MNKWFGLTLPAIAITLLTLTSSLPEAHSKPKRVALQADTGKWLARCNGCQQTVNDIRDTVSVTRNTPDAGHAQFEIVEVGGDKIAFKADTGKYLGRCNGCIIDGATPDFLVVFHSDPTVPHVQFTPELLSNGKYAFKSNTGKYVARCNRCSPSATDLGILDTVTVHVDDPTNKPHAQWNMIDIR